eukprot:2486483-Amphidinium_carterae.1
MGPQAHTQGLKHYPAGCGCARHSLSHLGLAEAPAPGTPEKTPHCQKGGFGLARAFESQAYCHCQKAGLHAA